MVSATPAGQIAQARQPDREGDHGVEVSEPGRSRTAGEAAVPVSTPGLSARAAGQMSTMLVGRGAGVEQSNGVVVDHKPAERGLGVGQDPLDGRGVPAPNRSGPALPCRD
jgi:hypothetical protein